MISVRDFGPIGIYTHFGYQTFSMNIKIGENSKLNTIKKHKKKNARKILPKMSSSKTKILNLIIISLYLLCSDTFIPDNC